MKYLLAAVVVAAAVCPVRADALRELLALAGPLDITVPHITPKESPAGDGVLLVPPSIIKATSSAWNAALPISRAAVEEVAHRIDPRALADFACDYVIGAKTVRCTYNYSADPKISDYAVVDVNVENPTVIRILAREWRK